MTHLLSLVPEVIQQVPMRYKLSDEAERLLQSHTPHHVHDVVTVTLRYLLHHVNLEPEVLPLLVRGSFCSSIIILKSRPHYLYHMAKISWP